ncbi:MAG: hypothetical protein ACLQVX_06370 [Limisphaerales bacterium]
MDGDNFKRLTRFVQSRIKEIGDSLKAELPLDGRPATVMDVAHAVLPPDDSSLQWSPPGSGISDNLSQTLESLFERLVIQYDERSQQERRTDDDVWRKYRRSLEDRHVLKHLQPKTISVQDDEVEFQYAWKNDVWHCLEPVSLDLSSADSIREKAHRWLGHIVSVKDAREPFKVYLLLGEPQPEALKSAFDKAVSILHRLPVRSEIIREANAAAFSEAFAREIEAYEAKG